MFDTERFNLGKLNDVEVNGIRLKLQVDLQLWKTWMMMMMMMMIAVGLGKLLEGM
jgi:hypothetical protein